MAKKQFTNSFQDIFSPTETKLLKQDVTKASADIDDKIQRTTLLLSSETYKTIKAIAYWERKQIKDIILNAGDKVDENAIREQAMKDGMWTLRRSGIERMKEGNTTLEEVVSNTTEED